MICAFLKPPADEACICRVLQAVDRLWVEEDWSVVVVREVIVQVDALSESSLSGLRALMTPPGAADVVDLSETLYDLDEPLNHRSTAGAFSVLAPPGPIGTGLSDTLEARICQYQFSDLVVFSKVETLAEAFFDAELLSWDFPRPLEPGERAMVRTRFRRPEVLPEDPASEYRHLELRYFDPRNVSRALENIVNLNRLELPTVLKEDGVSCGLDVAVFVPSSLSAGSASPEHETHTDTLGPHGRDGRLYVYYVWHPAAKGSMPLRVDKTRVRIDVNELWKRYSTGKTVQELHGTVDRLERSSKTSTRLSIISVVLAIASIVLALYLHSLVASGTSGTSESQEDGQTPPAAVEATYSP